MVDIVTYGEILWDVIEGEPHIGGAPFNLAAHAVRCGLRAAAVSSVGDDALGRSALAEMDRLAVDGRWTAVDAQHPTGTVTVTLAAGQPAYTIHEGVAWDHIRLSADALRALLAQRPRAVCFGTLAQRSEVSRHTLDSMLAVFRDVEIFYDVNLRQSFWSVARVADGLARATLVKVNDEEARVLGGALLKGATQPVDFGESLLHVYPGVHTVIVTCGADGCFVCQRGQSAVRCPGIRVNVEDAVGAGDAFSAAFLTAWLNGGTGAEAAEAGNQRGAWVASQAGAVPDEASFSDRSPLAKPVQAETWRSGRRFPA